MENYQYLCYYEVTLVDGTIQWICLDDSGNTVIGDREEYAQVYYCDQGRDVARRLFNKRLHSDICQLDLESKLAHWTVVLS